MNPAHIDALKRQIADTAAAVPGSERIVLMEVCGTHTVAIRRTGLRSLLPPRVRLVSGPGCPVCVTPQGVVDALVGLATREGVTVATFGDMLRVPGTRSSLERERARGGSVAVCYSVLEAMDLRGRTRRGRSSLRPSASRRPPPARPSPSRRHGPRGSRTSSSTRPTSG